MTLAQYTANGNEPGNFVGIAVSAISHTHDGVQLQDAVIQRIEENGLVILEAEDKTILKRWPHEVEITT